MNREDAKEFILQQEPTFLPAAKKISGKQSYVCPKCGNGSGADGTGITRDPRGKGHPHYKCFACGGYFDIIELYAMQTDRNVEEVGVYDDLYAYFGVSVDKGNNYTPKTENAPQRPTEADTHADFTEYYNECRKKITDIDAVTYLQARGISITTAAAAFVGYDPAADPAQSGHPAKRIIIPTSKSHYVGRAVDPETPKQFAKMNNKGGTPGIFNRRALYKGAGCVFVCEGAFDALSVLEVGREAVALNSTANTDKLVSILKEKPTDSVLIICLDSDEAGRTRAQKLFDDLRTIGARCVLADINGGHKDANEALTADKVAFIEAVEAAAVLKPEEPHSFSDDFLEKIQTETYRPYKTGLDFFDNLLDGGVIRQTVLLLLAAPAAGKTTLCLQIAEAIAKNKRPVLYFNYEMSREVMLAKSISAKLAREFNTFLSAVQILQGYSWRDNKPLKDKITAAVADYKKDTEAYLQVNPDIMTADVAELIKRLDAVGSNARAAGKEAPVIVIDYLHLLRSNKGEEASEIIKRALEGLHEYAVKYDTFVICISAANRESNKSGRITMESGRDTSSIEYSADYQLSLNYLEVDNGKIKPTDEDKLSALQRAPERDMILRVLKNRYGVQGKYIEVKFKAAYNLFYSQGEVLTPEVPFDDEPEQEQQTLFPAL